MNSSKSRNDGDSEKQRVKPPPPSSKTEQPEGLEPHEIAGTLTDEQMDKFLDELMALKGIKPNPLVKPVDPSSAS